MNHKRIAVVGSGIAGLTSALLLQKKYNVSLFEQNDYFGGHTHTIDVDVAGKRYPVNTGFIVYNDWTYPNFIRLMEHLGVASEPSNMSFSVHCDRSGLEYNGTTLNSLFCQRKNLLSPRFWRMVNDIIRFNRNATTDHLEGRISADATLQQYLDQNDYSEEFTRYYIIPMGAAIWSTSEADMLRFPFAFFVRFFHNHGMLSVNERPQWRVISGGSRSYVKALLGQLRGPVHVNRPVVRIERHDTGVMLLDGHGQREHFDAVVMACHSDQALQLLQAPTPNEQRVLGAIPYLPNDVVLHTDTRLLPERKLAWAAWNYRIPRQANAPVMLTYNMNILQNFTGSTTFCVSLNQTDNIDPAKVLARYNYSHPGFTLDGMAAQQRWALINGERHTYYCGAYWFNGFHEDGVNSAIRVAESLNVRFDEVIAPCKAHSTKAS
jgi:uncharacterized protein